MIRPRWAPASLKTRTQRTAPHMARHFDPILREEFKSQCRDSLSVPMSKEHKETDALHKELDTLHKEVESLRKVLDKVHSEVDALHKVVDSLHKEVDRKK